MPEIPHNNCQAVWYKYNIILKIFLNLLNLSSSLSTSNNTWDTVPRRSLRTVHFTDYVRTTKIPLQITKPIELLRRQFKKIATNQTYVYVLSCLICSYAYETMFSAMLFRSFLFSRTSPGTWCKWIKRIRVCWRYYTWLHTIRGVIIRIYGILYVVVVINLIIA